MCAACAQIPVDFRCFACGQEAAPYRAGQCARCALREDLDELMGHAPDVSVQGLIDALCRAERPESMIVWKRSAKVQHLLRSLGEGSIPATHEGLDSVAGRTTEHLRALMQQHHLLPHRDAHLSTFEGWIEAKLEGITPEVQQPVRNFATWHHLRRIREKARSGAPTRGPVHNAKQEITETLKFLTWLHEEHGRTVDTCTQQDVDEWLTSGPTTRTAIRTFIVKAQEMRMGLDKGITIPHRQARTSPSLSQDQRLAWLRELLTGTSESLPYRVAGTLLLLYAQPLVKVAALPTSAVIEGPTVMSLRLGPRPVDVPEPFAEMLRQHLERRPNMQTVNNPNSPWLFPGGRAGQHLHPNTVMNRLRHLGIDLRGARNRALGDLVLACPAVLVADALGYSRQVAFKHAQAAAEPWARYASQREE